MSEAMNEGGRERRKPRMRLKNQVIFKLEKQTKAIVVIKIIHFFYG